MKRCMSLLTAALVCALVAAPGFAAELGDAAFPLKITDWVKGEPVDLAKGKDKNIYVVEFWATWCPPCVASIPHITEMQKKYKDKGVVFIGVSDEPKNVVAPFVEKQGKAMDYTVACGPDTKSKYMGEFNQNGIPTAFIIDKSGRVAWVGHPMNGLEQTLEQVISGKYDITAAKRVMKARQQMEDYFKMAAEGNEKNATKMAALGATIIKDAGSDPGAMNEFSWVILTHPAIQKRDLKLAMEAAQLAYDGCKGKDWMIVDNYARALFDTGKVQEAVKHQTKALELCDQPKAKPELKEALERYKKKLPEA